MWCKVNDNFFFSLLQCCCSLCFEKKLISPLPQTVSSVLFCHLFPLTAGKNLWQHIYSVVRVDPSDHTEWVSSSEGWHDYTPWGCCWADGVTFLQSNGQRKRWGFHAISNAQQWWLGKLFLVRSSTLPFQMLFHQIMSKSSTSSWE